jgi:hypothetical protein
MNKALPSNRVLIALSIWVSATKEITADGIAASHVMLILGLYSIIHDDKVVVCQNLLTKTYTIPSRNGALKSPKGGGKC